MSLVLFSLGVLTCGLAPSMEVFVAGRVVQGLGTGALIVSLYVVVGVVYPARLQPSIFASFAAAWVLPRCSGRRLAALVADVFGWRWVFLGVVALVVLAAALIAPVVPGAAPADAADGDPRPRSRLAWAVARRGGRARRWSCSALRRPRVAAVAAVASVLVALRPLTPRGTLRAGRGLPSVIGTRGLMSARVLLRPGLHRAGAAAALGPHGRPGRDRPDGGRRGVGLDQPAAGAAAASGSPASGRC